MPDFDLIVIGGGPAGYVGAIRAAQLGKKVVLIERERPGGTCLHWGCIPTKSLLRSAELYHQIQNAGKWGIRVTGVEVDFPGIIQRSRQISDRLTKGIESLFKKHQVECLKGTATITAPGEVSCVLSDGSSRMLKGSRILVATGARPRHLPHLTVDGKGILTSREALVLEALPKSIAIIGAGAIGVEFAWFFKALGSEVTLVEMLPQILPQEDDEVAVELVRQFTRGGMKVFTETQVKSAQTGADGVSLELTGKNPATLQVEKVLVAVGLEGVVREVFDAGLSPVLEKGFLKTDERYQTSIPGVYGAGDVIGPPWLAHVASWEAIQAVEGMFAGRKPKRVTVFPSCIYCQPQVASVGMSERKVRESGVKFKTGKFPFLSLGKALAAGDNSGFVKLIFNEADGKILGAHIIGSEATELISEVNLGMNMQATRDHLVGTIHAHPTLSEALGEAAAGAEGESVHQ